MIEKTRGIFLHYINYSDSSVIAQVYTEKFGRQSYLVNGIRSKKSGVKINLFQPLFLLEMEVYHKPGRNLQRIKSVRFSNVFDDIPFDIKKRSQSVFLAEILLKCLNEEEANPDLFEYLYHAICLLDLSQEGTANFSVAFLFRLTRYLGVFPRFPENNGNRFFDLVSASFRKDEPSHHQFMNMEVTGKFLELFDYELSEINRFSYCNDHRAVLLAKLLDYYRIHLDLTSEIKSFTVLKEVLT